MAAAGVRIGYRRQGAVVDGLKFQLPRTRNFDPSFPRFFVHTIPCNIPVRFTVVNQIVNSAFLPRRMRKHRYNIATNTLIQRKSTCGTS